MVCRRSTAGLVARESAHVLTASSEERHILDLMAEGHTNREIAAAINLSDKTVKNYVSSILHKLEVQRRAEAASYVTRAHARESPWSKDAG